MTFIEIITLISNTEPWSFTKEQNEAFVSLNNIRKKADGFISFNANNGSTAQRTISITWDEKINRDNFKSINQALYDAVDVAFANSSITLTRVN